MDLNPFESVIVSEPRRIERPVSGLNAAPLDALLGRVQQLSTADFPRAAKLSGAAFIQSPAPGYGKSHLIGRLFKQLRGRATLVYLRPYTHAATCWRSILLKLVQELEFPENAEAEFCLEDEPNQLEALVHGILLNLVLHGITGGRIKVKDAERQAALRYFRNVTLEQLRTNRKWAGWVFEKRVRLAGLMEGLLKQRGIFLNASPISWFGVLTSYAYRPRDYELRQACLDWLRGGSIDDDEASAVGILPADRLPHDLAMEPLNSAAKERITDFCGLAGFYRPFVFCFDQTENYGSDPVIAKSLGIVIQGLVDDCLNHLTVLTANQHPWHKVVLPNWEKAHRDRIAAPPLELRGLNREQALELIHIRLDGWKPPKEKAAAVSEPRWVEDLFAKSRELGVRHFLVECSRRWRQPAEAGRARRARVRPGAALDLLFQTYLNQVKAQPKRMVYDPDALYWLVHEVGPRPGAAAKKFKSLKGYLTARWEVDRRPIYFGFEAGHHFRRWHAIQVEAERYHAAESAGKSVFFRTPELRPIPGERWKSAGEMEAAKAAYLHILEVGRPEMAEIYAAYDLYLDAVDGDVEATPEAVVAFVRERLGTFWERVLEPDPRKWGAGPGGGPPGTDQQPLPEPQGNLVGKIRDILRREKFLSVTDLLSRITPPVSEEELHRARACIPEIQVHAGPSMTVLQWRRPR